MKNLTLFFVILLASQSLLAQYCIPSSSSSFRYIGSFSANVGLDNSNSGAGTSGYTDATAQIVTRYAGGKVDFVVNFEDELYNPGNPNSQKAAFGFVIWVDWNGDNDFDDTDEEVYNSVLRYYDFISDHFIVPAAAVVGNYRMRIRARASFIPVACGDLSYSEAEDYTMTIVTTPTCLPPTSLSVVGTTANTAQLAWTTSSGASTWEVVVQDFDSGLPAGNGTSVTNNPYTVMSLMADHHYEYYVRNDCGAGDKSEWAGPFSFYTACEALDGFLLEDFESVPLNNCWTQSTAFKWYIGSSRFLANTGPEDGAAGTNNFLYAYSGNATAGSEAVIYTQAIDLTNTSAQREVSFYYHMYGVGMDPDGSLDVAISTDGGTSYTSIFNEVGNKGDHWALFKKDISAYSGVISFRITGKAGTANDPHKSNFAIDEFKVGGVACPDPNWAILPASVFADVTKQSNDYCLDASGWTHYYDRISNEVLLSLKLDATAVVPYDAVSIHVKDEIQLNAFWVPSAAGKFVNNTNGGAVFIYRSWDVAATVQPAQDVGVKFYFSETEYIEMNTHISNINGSATKLNSVEEMRMFKVLNGTDPFAVANLAEADGIDIAFGTMPSTTTWTHSLMGANHVAEFMVSGFSGGGAGGVPNGGAILPVVLSRFSGVAGNINNTLVWRTESEHNSSHFIVERSLPGSLRYESIGKINAHGNSNIFHEYSFVDEHPEKLAYYRLKMVDFDGQFEYSNSISLSRAANGFGLFAVYPVPAETEVNVEFETKENRRMQLSLMDLSGKIILGESFNSVVGFQKHLLNLSKVPSGTYILQLSDGYFSYRQRVVK